MDLPTLISKTRPSTLGVLGFFLQILIEHSALKQIVKILIRHRIMRCLIWVCTVCLYPIKRTLVAVSGL